MLPESASPWLREECSSRRRYGTLCAARMSLSRVSQRRIGMVLVIPVQGEETAAPHRTGSDIVGHQDLGDGAGHYNQRWGLSETLRMGGVVTAFSFAPL